MFEYAGSEFTPAQRKARDKEILIKQEKKIKARARSYHLEKLAKLVDDKSVNPLAAEAAALDITAPGMLSPIGLTHIGAAYFGVRDADVLSKRRSRRRVLCRYIVFHFLRARNPKHWTFTQLGRIYGYDHTTAVHGIAAVRKLAGCDPEFARQLAQLEDILRSTGKWI